ncbi:MAG TPA: AmmeMemoRadiSam system protein B [Ignavibacteriaceae bacterium]|nr:AmmeMemoRadiSam system protein B [Ignavibacteriaceae bacterium]
MKQVRQAQVAGYFYPSDPQKLKREISILLDIAKPQKSYHKIFGIVAPHAGYVYSGKTAAYAYNLLKDKNIKTAIVISPSHSEYFPGVCVYEGYAYETPFGEIEVDKEITEKLCEESRIIFKGVQGHRKEHALEVQLPFLQSVIKDFKIVPIVIGDQGKMYIDELAKKLCKVYDENTLIVASSDLSHFHNSETADQLDSIVEKRINDFDFENLQKDLELNNCEACGGGPIVAMMKAASLLNVNHSEVLIRTDSGDVTGDKSEVVGYLSAVIYKN